MLFGLTPKKIAAGVVVAVAGYLAVEFLVKPIFNKEPN